MPTYADTQIVDPTTGEVLASPGQALDDELLYRMEVIGVKAQRPKRITFGVTCPHCGAGLTGEAITEVSHPSLLHTLFYTESDHQLAYSGLNLESVHCLDTLDGTKC